MMPRCPEAEVDRIINPLFAHGARQAPAKATELELLTCPIEQARLLNKRWHSRLPETQKSPWQHAFAMVCDHVIYAVALLHNPSARTLPDNWVELRRMAVAPDAPHCTASRFLSQLVKWFRENDPERERMISYQDCAVHTGTIYRAAGWTVGRKQRARKRDRSKPRPSGRLYRTRQNGMDVDVSAKIRWECEI